MSKMDDLLCVYAYRSARKLIEHENELVHHRMTWFYGMNTVLVAGYYNLVTSNCLKVVATSHQNIFTDWIYQSMLVFLLSSFALIFCRVISDGIHRAYASNLQATTTYGEFIQNDGRCPFLPPLHVWNRPKWFDQLYLPRVVRFFWHFLAAGYYGRSAIVHNELWELAWWGALIVADFCVSIFKDCFVSSVDTTKYADCVANTAGQSELPLCNRFHACKARAGLMLQEEIGVSEAAAPTPPPAPPRP
jgi:hypothetical protein